MARELPLWEDASHLCGFIKICTYAELLLHVKNLAKDTNPAIIVG